MKTKGMRLTMNSTIVILILGMALVTYLPRALPAVIIDKMKFYKDFYDNFVPLDSGFKSLPQLIIVCEDDRNMAEVFRELVTNNITFNNINLYYTTDLKQNSESLENTLTEFKLDEKTNKYKAQNIDLKLLN